MLSRNSDFNVFGNHAKLSQRKVAELLLVDESSVRRAVKGAALNGDLEAETIAREGFDGAALSWLIDYILFDSKRLSKGTINHCRKIYRQASAKGFQDFIDALAGIEVQSVQKLPQTYLEALQALVEVEKEKLALQARVEVQNEVIDELFNYSSIIRIAKYNNCDEKLFNWRSLKDVSLKRGLEIKQVPCPRFKTKNLYSHQAWAIAYPEVQLPSEALVLGGAVNV